MLPASTSSRVPREISRGKKSPRSQEIQRLIGRSLRGTIDLSNIPGNSIYVDCDVINADGGTRTASITGAFTALNLAIIHGIDENLFTENIKKDKNNNDCETKLGKKLMGNKIPTKIDFEKSGLGKNNKPTAIPIIIEIYAFFSLIDLVKKL